MKTRIVSMICGLILIPLATIAQNSLKGTVTNTDGEPIYGAKVVFKNTFLGAITDPDGLYEIKNPPVGEGEVVVSYAGYEELTESITIVSGQNTKSFVLGRSVLLIEDILVIDTRANDRTPTSYTNIKREQIADATNFGQDLPMLLRFTPSTVATSDAGAGVGYTGIRIRGVDPTRTNVTINGIPVNDSESHGVWWVNMPDFVSSAGDIQVQRGVGTSANGAAAFGASININTHDMHRKAYGVIDNGYGSFNTWRHTVKAGTGLIDDKFSMNARLSSISSDGYIDRATSDLKSFYVSGSWTGKKSAVKANIFTGKENTYQAWWGTPESVIKGDKDDIIAYADRNWIFGEDRENLLNSGRTYNYYTYENEVDNYQQDHYQLHVSHSFTSHLKLNVKGHYTRGKGYYEQYRADDDFATYGFTPLIFGSDTISTTDLIRRRWLDNYFYGGIFSLNYKAKGADITLGGGANEYLGGHFGEVIWAEFASDSEIRDHYYDNKADKFEAQAYAKGTLRKKKVTYFLDIQYRYIDYSFLGIDDVNGTLVDTRQEATFNFVNPKAGFMIDFNNQNNAYLSIAVANREPVRADFRENTPENRPEHEELMNLEVGYRFKSRRFMANANVYHMNYVNQLVLTGQINDVGGYTRTNVDNSHRTGLELEVGYRILDNLSLTANATLSENKIAQFTEYIDNYDTFVQDEIVHNNTDLAFSPNLIAAFGLCYEPVKGLELMLQSKYVGEQYLDNTSSDDRKLDAYFFTNAQLTYTLKDVLFKEMIFGVQINNVFNELYENNGYTWGYVAGGERTIENFYYPQAGRHFMTRLTIKL